MERSCFILQTPEPLSLQTLYWFRVFSLFFNPLEQEEQPEPRRHKEAVEDTALETDKRTILLIPKGLKNAYQWAILQCIEHFKVTAGLKTVKVRDMLPESINTSQCQEPL